MAGGTDGRTTSGACWGLPLTPVRRSPASSSLTPRPWDGSSATDQHRSSTEKNAAACAHAPEHQNTTQRLGARGETGRCCEETG
jgi:hypothetical protein